MGAVTDEFDIRESIAVEMEYEVLRGGSLCTTEFTFRNEEDVLLFIVLDRDPEWHRRTRPAGRYISTAWIPGNFLAEGTLIVGAGIITEVPWQLHCDVPNALVFHVVEHTEKGSARGNSAEKWMGVVRPFLRWTTEMHLKGTE